MIIANYKCPQCQKTALQRIIGDNGFYVVPRLFCDCDGSGESIVVEMEIIDFGRMQETAESEVEDESTN